MIPMSEWWTYGLSDFLMFSPRTYWRLVAGYNRAMWPAQPLLLVAGAVLAWMAVKRPSLRRATWIALALAWAWVGWAFHWERYAAINWAASYFAFAFAAETALLAGLALRSEPAAGGSHPSGLLLAHAGLLYPLAAVALGRTLAESETFALMPEPTALVTLGLLLALRPGGWRWAAVIPVASLALGFTTLALLAR